MFFARIEHSRKRHLIESQTTSLAKYSINVYPDRAFDTGAEVECWRWCGKGVVPEKFIKF
jgi:hypothetical protein